MEEGFGFELRRDYLPGSVGGTTGAGAEGAILVHRPQGQGGFRSHSEGTHPGFNGSVLCSNRLEVGTRGPTFSFAPSPANYITGPAMGFIFFIVGPWGTAGAQGLWRAQ